MSIAILASGTETRSCCSFARETPLRGFRNWQGGADQTPSLYVFPQGRPPKSLQHRRQSLLYPLVAASPSRVEVMEDLSLHPSRRNDAVSLHGVTPGVQLVEQDSIQQLDPFPSLPQLPQGLGFSPYSPTKEASLLAASIRETSVGLRLRPAVSSCPCRWTATSDRCLPPQQPFGLARQHGHALRPGLPVLPSARSVDSFRSDTVVETTRRHSVFNL